jgi:hypothetical protein
VKLIEVWHGHDDHFGVQEKQDKGKEGIEVEGCDVG